MPIGFWAVSRQDVRRILEQFISVRQVRPLSAIEKRHRIDDIVRKLPDRLEGLLYDAVLGLGEH